MTSAETGNEVKQMTEFRAIWEIDIEAETPREAAEKALKLQRDVFSTATVFIVRDQEDGEEYQIDLEVEEVE